MEEDAEMGEDSTSRVSMRAAGGTFIAGTADAPVATARATKRRKNASEHVSEDLLNRQIRWSLPNGPKIMCGSSSGNTIPRSWRVLTISGWRSMPSARSAWRTSPDVGFAPCKWAKTIHRLRCWIT